MKDVIRTFVALKIQPEQKLIDQLNEFKRLFRNERINWVPENNFHLTLRFIGDTTREQLCKLVDGLNALTPQFSSFEIKVEGTGYFSAKGKPRVLFLKVVYPEELQRLVSGVEQLVIETGFHPELKQFRPHLTLGRIKHLENSNRFFNVLDSLPQHEYQHQMVSEIILYQSTLRPEGPVYKSIQKFEFDK